MTWRKPCGPGRHSYHHGNLREAIVAAALDLIAKKGPGGLTFAEVARVSGVSPAAPYRHFSGREALIAALAERGFGLLAQKLRAAWDSGTPDPLAALQRTSRAYLEFSRSEPALFMAMFDPAAPPATPWQALPPAAETFAVLRTACEAAAALAPAGPRRPPTLMMTLNVWALMHGTATLFANKEHAGAQLPSLPITPEELLEAGLLVYLDGLGLTRR